MPRRLMVRLRFLIPPIEVRILTGHPALHPLTAKPDLRGGSMPWVCFTLAAADRRMARWGWAAWLGVTPLGRGGRFPPYKGTGATISCLIKGLFSLVCCQEWYANGWPQRSLRPAIGRSRPLPCLPTSDADSSLPTTDFDGRRSAREGLDWKENPLSAFKRR